MGCNDKVEHNCGSINYATCIRYENGVSNNSELTAGCSSVDDAIQDIYNQIDNIDDKIDLSLLESTCINFTAPKTLQSILAQICDKICTLEATATTQAGLIETLQAQIVAIQESPCN